MKVLLLSLCFLTFSCNLHEQNNITGVKAEAKVVNLSIIEEISSAIVKNDYSAISTILEGGNFEINIPDKSGELILNKAIKNHRFVIGKLLIKSGAKPEVEDGAGETAMSLAEKGRYLVDWSSLFAGTNLTVPTATTQVFSLLEASNPTNEEKFLPLIRNYFELGAPFEGVNDGKFTYLMVASSKNLVGVVSLLCEYPEIDPNITVERGRGRRKKTFSALILATTDEMRNLLGKCGAIK